MIQTRARPRRRKRRPRARFEQAGKQDTDAPTLANAVWKQHRQRIEAACGDKAWKSWLCMLTPHADDGSTLVLAAPNKFLAEYSQRKFAQKIGEITKRTIEITERTYAGPAARERQRRESNAGASL